MTQAANIPVGRGLGKGARANWIRLRTMIVLRWVAIAGQLTAITVAQRIFGLQLELGLCYFAIGVSVIGNLIAILVFPENKRLSEYENLLMVLFDLVQLAFLLFLTGGLHNPFSLLLLGPVTISATALSLRSTIVLCGTAIGLATGLALFHLPLITQDGGVLELPGIFIFGIWIALVIAIVFSTAYSRRVTTEIHSMADALAATQMALARELNMCLAFGCAEKIGKNVYNCAVFIDQNGRLCGKYHKMQLAEGSHPSWWSVSYTHLTMKTNREM